MRKVILIISQLMFVAVFALTVGVSAADDSVTAKSDTEIQQCIAERLAASPSLKDQGFSASVSNGTATLTGTARNPGSKGAASNIAKKCGAGSVANKIAISATYKPTKKAGGEKTM